MSEQNPYYGFQKESTKGTPVKPWSFPEPIIAPALMHSGSLDRQGRHEVGYARDRDGSSFVYIEHNELLGMRSDKDELVELTPKQALELLKWLKQEEEILESLARE